MNVPPCRHRFKTHSTRRAQLLTSPSAECRVVGMRYLILTTLAVTCVCGAAAAPTSAGGWGEALSPSNGGIAKAMHATIRRNLAEAAERMPAEEYAFKPT